MFGYFKSEWEKYPSGDASLLVAICASPLLMKVSPLMRDKNQNTNKGGNAIMKKLFLLLAAVAILGVTFVSRSYAATSDNAYVVVRCTVDVSVDVIGTGDADTVYMGTWNNPHYDAGPDSVYVSSYVTVRNTSSGAITKWQLAISTQQQSETPFSGFAATDATYPAWSYGTALTDNGANKVVLAAVFKSTAASAGDFADNDVLDATGKYYQTTNLIFGPASDSYASSIASGSNYNMVNPYNGADSERNLYFYVRTPSAVTDMRYRKFTVTVTASLGL